MWEFLAKQLLKKAGREIGGTFFNDEANGPEAYADRIKREFHLHDYADAWALYDSDRAYWENYYRELAGGPAWNNVFVRDSAAAAGVPGRNNIFEYGFPESSSAQPSIGEAPAVRRSATEFIPSNNLNSVGGVASNPKWPAFSSQMGLHGANGSQLPASVFDVGEAGLGGSIGTSTAGTYPSSPRHIADFLNKYGLAGPPTGPGDGLLPLMRPTQEGAVTVGQPSNSAVRFLASSDPNPLGGGMAGWRPFVNAAHTPQPMQSPSPQLSGGLFGLLLDHLRNN